MQKYSDEKCLYCSSFFCFLTLHAGTGDIHIFLGFLIMLVFQSRISNQLFAVNARNSLKSQKQSRLLLKLRQLRCSTAIEHSESNYESSFAGANNEQAVDNFNFRTDDLSTDLHVYRQRRFRARDHYKEIQSRNEARILQNTKRPTTCLHGVREFGMTG